MKKWKREKGKGWDGTKEKHKNGRWKSMEENVRGEA